MPIKSELLQRHWREAVIFCVASLGFLPALWGDFVFDDRWFVVENEHTFSVWQALDAFFEPTYPGNLYRPIGILSFSIERTLFGEVAAPFHLTNIVLHGICSVLVYLVLVATRFTGAAFLTAILFGIHPAKAEAVVNITGRYELLAATFSLSAILAMFRGLSSELRSDFWFALAAVAALLAMLSKESAFCLPLLGALALFVSSTRASRSDRQTLAALAIAAISLALCCRVAALGTPLSSTPPIAYADNPLVVLDFAERAFHAITLLGRHAFLLVAPFQLSADYSFAHIAPSLTWTFETLSYQLCASALLAWLCLSLWRGMPGCFAPAWFFGSFLATSNLLFPIGTIFAERLSYLPSIGIMLGLAWMLGAIRGEAQRYVALTILTLFSFGLSFEQSLKWRTNETLWRAQASISPRSVRTQLNLAVVHRNNGELDEARRAAKRALRRSPELAQPRVILATIAIANESEKEAETLLKEALKIDPTHREALNLLGRLAFAGGRVRQAGKLFRLTQRLHPGDFPSLVGQLAVLIQEQKWERARELGKVLKRRRPEDAELERLLTAIP